MLQLVLGPDLLAMPIPVGLSPDWFSILAYWEKKFFSVQLCYKCIGQNTIWYLVCCKFTRSKFCAVPPLVGRWFLHEWFSQNRGEWRRQLSRVWSPLCPGSAQLSDGWLSREGEGWPLDWPNQQLCQLAEVGRVPEKLGHEKVPRRFAAGNGKPRQSTSRRLPPAACQLVSQLWEGSPAPVAMWHQDLHILLSHQHWQAPPCLERVGRVGHSLSLLYRPPTYLHFVGKCTEAAKTCALCLRKDLQPVLKLEIRTIYVNMEGFVW